MKKQQKEYDEEFKKYQQLADKSKSKEPGKPGLRYAKKGDTVKVHYTGKLKETDHEFDNSYNRKIPLEFTVGVGQVCCVRRRSVV
jgi:FKBP-type peptidyl-prolyl cis-trans isomerase